MADEVDVVTARDREEIRVHANGQIWSTSWHPAPMSPTGTRHGSLGICVTAKGEVVLVSEDGEHWDLPAGRPEGNETWEQTLRREMLEEACATVVRARLLGFSRGECIEGPEQGLVLVRSFWRADVELGPWQPEFEIAHRRLVAPNELVTDFVSRHPFAPIIRRAIAEAGLL